jgi:hypothetical protein
MLPIMFATVSVQSTALKEVDVPPLTWFGGMVPDKWRHSCGFATPLQPQFAVSSRDVQPEICQLGLVPAQEVAEAGAGG